MLPNCQICHHACEGDNSEFIWYSNAHCPVHPPQTAIVRPAGTLPGSAPVPVAVFGVAPKTVSLLGSTAALGCRVRRPRRTLFARPMFPAGALETTREGACAPPVRPPQTALGRCLRTATMMSLTELWPLVDGVATNMPALTGFEKSVFIGVHPWLKSQTPSVRSSNPICLWPISSRQRKAPRLVASRRAGWLAIFFNRQTSR